MNESCIVQLLERLGCQRVKKRGDEITCSCPFSNNHKHGDRHPSFGARVNSDGLSPYHCFSCGANGAMEGLAVQSGHPDLVPDYKPRKITRTRWNHSPPRKPDPFGGVAGEKRVLFKDVYLDPFIGIFHDYFISRNIFEETARIWELGFDARFKRVTFVVRDYLGRLAVLIGRDITGRSGRIKYSNYVLDLVEKELIPYFPRERDESEFISPTKKFFLYGEHLMWSECRKSENAGRDLVIVEGPMDVLSMWQRGYFVLGTMGSYPSGYQIEKMVTMTPRGGRLVVMGDGDKAGETLTDGIAKGVDNRVPVYNAKLAPEKDPASTSDEEVVESICCAKIIRLTRN